jgi:hypothetical protein
MCDYQADELTKRKNHKHCKHGDEFAYAYASKATTHRIVY